jgi:Protein of unknown function (DUF3499)
MRTCARSGCNSPAAAILTYDSAAQTAYLYSVDDPSTRAPGDLCERHVNRLVIPRSWQLDDRRADAAAVVAAPAVATAGPKVRRARAARAQAPRGVPRRKWAEVEPSLFEAPAPLEPATGEPAWMPRFVPDSELDGVLDAKTPLLRRAFGAR